MDNDHEAYPEEKTLDEWIDGLSENERYGNLLYEEVMRQRAVEYERKEAESLLEQERHRAWANRARSERLAAKKKTDEAAKKRRDEQLNALGTVAAEIGSAAFKTAAFGLGIFCGICSAVIQGVRDEK